MKTIILPVFDEEDLNAVPNALEFFRNVGLEQLMVLHNPSLGLKGVVTAQYDSRIKELEAAMSEAGRRTDFAAAAQYKEQLESAKTDKDLAIREGWTKIPQAEREATYKRIFGKIGTEAIFCLNENMRKDQVFAALNGFLEVWPKDVEHGEFSIVWPLSIPKQRSPKMTLSENVGCKSAHNVPRGTNQNLDQSTPEGRKSALIASRFGGVKSACKKHGIDTTGRSMADLIDMVIEKEFPPVAA